MTNSRDAIRVYRAPSSLPLDLAKSEFDETKFEESESQASPVEWVLASAPNEGPGQIFTFRNNLNKLLGTTISPRNEWEIDGCWKDGSLLLDIVKTPQVQYEGLWRVYSDDFDAL